MQPVHPWKCFACRRHFRFKVHFLKHKSLNDCLQCRICHQFDLLEELNCHYKTCHKLKHTFRKCSYKTDTENCLIQHIISEHNITDIFPCDIYSKKFKRWDVLKRHMETTHTKIKCDNDPLEDPLYIPYYKNFIGTSIDSPIVTDADDSKYKIEIIENFNLQEELNRDIKKDHELSDNSYDNVLPRESIQNVSLSENSNTSVTDRPEAYDVNSGVIARVESESFSECTACHKRFKYKTDFEKHRNLNYCLQCHICYQKFDLLEEFNLHIKTHRKFMSYDCYVCSYKTDTVKYLTEHMKSEQNTTDICKCVICTKTFKRLRSLKKHKETVHADNTQSIMRQVWWHL
ncbi:putative zinc finger protein 840 [Odontomachus brunneus]|uniref:putative zinc finger protein 840 n=1 Tax=Odontomachus brunneus TaxID=486640 RepID=UPI0013F1A308|nr:putative zinc finger protein 840 [Odontomachus brunneus]